MYLSFRNNFVSLETRAVYFSSFPPSFIYNERFNYIKDTRCCARFGSRQSERRDLPRRNCIFFSGRARQFPQFTFALNSFSGGRTRVSPGELTAQFATLCGNNCLKMIAESKTGVQRFPWRSVYEQFIVIH